MTRIARYEYQAEVLKVIDGDTIRVRLDLGIDTRINLTLRLMAINAPEMSTEEGKAAKAFLAGLIEAVPVKYSRDGYPIIVVRTIKDRREKYGRYLAYLYSEEHMPDEDDWTFSMNEAMVAAGHAIRNG